MVRTRSQKAAHFHQPVAFSRGFDRMRNCKVSDFKPRRYDGSRASTRAFARGMAIGYINHEDITLSLPQSHAPWKRKAASSTPILPTTEQIGQAQPAQDQRESGPPIGPLPPAAARPQPTY